MKKLIGVLALSLAMATAVYAHCGKCGVDGGHAHTEGAAAHSGAQCPMHGENNAVLTEAAKALETSNPDISKKLSDLAAKCCGEHKG